MVIPGIVSGEGRTLRAWSGRWIESVIQTDAGSPAARGGLGRGDIGVNLDGHHPAPGVDALQRILAADLIGEATYLLALRGHALRQPAVLPGETQRTSSADRPPPPRERSNHQGVGRSARRIRAPVEGEGRAVKPGDRGTGDGNGSGRKTADGAFLCGVNRVGSAVFDFGSVEAIAVVSFMEKERFGLIVLLTLVATAGWGQERGSEDGLWREVDAAEVAARGGPTRVSPPGARVFELDVGGMKSRLAAAPGEGEISARTKPLEMAVPLPDGGFARFAIEETALMHPDLAAKFPEIRTYVGRGIDEPAASARLDWSPRGFHAQILKPSGAVMVDPAEKDGVRFYRSYARRDLPPRDGKAWTCLVEGRGAARGAGAGLAERGLTSGATLRTYRLAVACTGEYTAFHGGTVSGALSAIVTTINRVTGIYETELAIRFQLVANNDQVVYTDAASDPYSNDDAGSMINQNITALDGAIGSANYDIGHVFSTGAGGLAGLGVVCGPGKARGVTGTSQPVGDAFDVDYVAHEIGHQFDADHTFNGDSGSCSGANRNASTAYEPGSGSSIMAYAGICGNDNLQSNSDPFFHSESHAQITAFVTTGGGAGCGTPAPTGNQLPGVDAGPDRVIPRSTPFELTAAGSDPDGDPLTYSWEQRDLGPQQDVEAGDTGAGPLFRFRPPTESSTRVFPRLDDLVDNTTAIGETVPTTSRTLNFRCTVRDNRGDGGGVSSDDMKVTVDGAAGPFAVTFPNTAVTLSGSQTVSWDVAGTAGGQVNTPNVDIFLSTDGGLTYPIQLAAGAPNSGSAEVTLPNLDTVSARIKVKGAGNVFFDISNADFAIEPASGLAITPIEPLASSGLEGGPFQPGCRTYQLRNTGGAPLNWQAGVDAPWAGLSPAGGSLSAGAAVSVDLCLRSAADALADGTYSATASFTNLANGAVQVRGVGLTVLPAGGLLQFASPAYEAVEGQGTATITVIRVGDTTGAVGVTYATAPGSATAGSDYVPVAGGTLNWGGGDGAPKSFPVTLVDDALLESAETVLLRLSNPTGGAELGMPTTAILTVADNDSNDECASPRVIAGSPFTSTQSTAAATSGGDPSPSCAPNFGNGVWYQYTAPDDGTLFIDTGGSDYDTVLAAYSGACGALAEIGCDDDGGPSLTSSLTLEVLAGTTYRFLAGGYNSAVGELVMNAAFVPGGQSGADNDLCVNAVEVPVTPFLSYQTTTGATSTGDPVPECTATPANGVWYRFTAPRDGFLRVDLGGSGFDTVVSVYTGSCGALAPIDCNDDIVDARTSVVDTFVASGTTAYVLCGGYDGDKGGLSVLFAFDGCEDGVLDGDFEAGTPWPAWTEQSSVFFGTPLDAVNVGPTSAPLSGANWAYFYGPNRSRDEVATLGQSVVLPAGASVTLRYQLWVGRVEPPFGDTLEVLVDGTPLAGITEPSFAEFFYAPESVDLSAYADGSPHAVVFRFTSPANGGISDWNLDNVQLKICRPDFDQDGIPDEDDPDDDNDGIPDAWEITNGLNPLDPADAALDLDGDLASGWEEYVADTSPTNTLSVLKLDILPRPPGGGDGQPLSFEGSGARRYYVEVLTDLVNGPWLPGPTNIPGNGGVSTLVVTNPAPVLHFRLGAELP